MGLRWGCGFPAFLRRRRQATAPAQAQDNPQGQGATPPPGDNHSGGVDAGSPGASAAAAGEAAAAGLLLPEESSRQARSARRSSAASAAASSGRQSSVQYHSGHASLPPEAMPLELAESSSQALEAALSMAGRSLMAQHLQSPEQQPSGGSTSHGGLLSHLAMESLTAGASSHDGPATRLLHGQERLDASGKELPTTASGPGLSPSPRTAGAASNAGGTGTAAGGVFGLELTTFWDLWQQMSGHFFVLGRGGHGIVLEGVWRTGTRVAIKVIVSDCKDRASPFYREAVLSNHLRHPNVVQTYAVMAAPIDEAAWQHVLDMYASSSRNIDDRMGSEHSTDSFDGPSVNSRTGTTNRTGSSSAPSVSFVEVLFTLGARAGSCITTIFMDFCDAGTLGRAIKDKAFRDWEHPLLAQRVLLRTAREVAMGMAHLHSLKVVHGDLKPSNVLLKSQTSDKRGFYAKVGDFGLSTVLASSSGAQEAKQFGTLAYAAPECLNNQVMLPSDVWSFGVMLWELVTGTRPFKDWHPGRLLVGIYSGELRLDWPPTAPAGIQDLATRCMAHSPWQRPKFIDIVEELRAQEHEVAKEYKKAKAAAAAGAATSGGSGPAATASPGTDSPVDLSVHSAHGVASLSTALSAPLAAGVRGTAASAARGSYFRRSTDSSLHGPLSPPSTASGVPPSSAWSHGAAATVAERNRQQELERERLEWGQRLLTARALGPQGTDAAAEQHSKLHRSIT